MIRDTTHVVLESFEPSTTLLITGKSPLGDADLDAWLLEFNRFKSRSDVVRVIVLSDGGGPTNAMRKRMTDAVGDDVKKIKNAIISDTASVRFVASTLSFFTDNIWSFSPREIHSALKALSYSDREQDNVLRELGRLARAIPAGRFASFDAAMAHIGHPRG
jgi:hypothetical protein